MKNPTSYKIIRKFYELQNRTVVARVTKSNGNSSHLQIVRKSVSLKYRPNKNPLVNRTLDNIVRVKISFGNRARKKILRKSYGNPSSNKIVGKPYELQNRTEILRITKSYGNRGRNNNPTEIVRKSNE